MSPQRFVDIKRLVRLPLYSRLIYESVDCSITLTIMACVYRTQISGQFMIFLQIEAIYVIIKKLKGVESPMSRRIETYGKSI